MERKLLPIAIGFVLASHALAENAPPNEAPPKGDASIPVTYVGSNLRVSLGIDQDGDMLGELLGVFGKTDEHAWLGQLWLGQGGAGGVQLDYHWLHGSADDANVWSVFGAADQNAWKDRKVSLGLGWERDDLSIGGYLMHAVTGSRRVGTTTDSTSTILTGTDEGGPYTQVQTVETLTTFFEHPYDNGVGLRLGKYFDDPLIRLRGGLDYERGKYGSDQFTLSLGVDKYFANTGFSLSLEGEALKKSGDFETDRNDTRGWLLLRYDFGQTFRAREPFRNVRVEREVPVAAPTPAPVVVRNEVRLDSDAFFDFDHSDLRADALAALADVVEKLKTVERVSRITIVGHTDSIGTVAYNQKLSERRAASAKRYLVEHGIAADEIDTTGAGELHPDFPNDTPANRQKNRRVDIDFLTIEESTEPAPTPAPTTKTVVEWVKEPVEAPPAWIERALRTPAEHKRTVDVYRFEKSTTTTTTGPHMHAPVAADDTAIVAENSRDNPIDVLANDSDADGDALTIVSVSAPMHGSAAVAGSMVSYTPSADYLGEDSFTYTIDDGHGGTASATVHVTVGTPNHPPVAGTLTVRVMKGSAIDIPVLQAASDPDGDPLTVIAVDHDGPLTDNIVTINPDNTVRYESIHGSFGLDYFEYTVSDGRGGTATGRIEVDVRELPPPPP